MDSNIYILHLTMVNGAKFWVNKIGENFFLF